MDVVIENPPYIRYQLFSGKTREKALRIAKREGVKLNGLTASWVPFVIHAERFLKKEGRMAFVLPSKLLHVKYAKPFRKWLLRKFADITIIAFDRRVFSEILEDTILLLADKQGSSGVRFIRVSNEKELSTTDLSSIQIIHPRAEEKWTKYLLPSKMWKELHSILEKVKDEFVPLGSFGFVTIGVVTGSNDFFTLTEREVLDWGIEEKYLLPLVSKAEDLSGIRVTNDDWLLSKKLGHKCYLLHLTEPWERLGARVRDYLEQRGRELDVRSKYKVRIRKVWYEVPGVRFPDLFISYMSHEVPKIAVNEVNLQGKKATSTNTIHQVFLKSRIDPLILAVSFYNSLTLVSAELTGRFYGGGVLKLEPKEVERILVPNMTEVKIKTELIYIVDELLRSGKVHHAVSLVDGIILEESLGLTTRDVKLLNDVWIHLQKQRINKG